MTSRILVLATCLFVAAAGTARAQQSPQAPQAPQPGQAPRAAIPPPAPAPPAAPAAPRAPAPRREGQPINVRVDFNITDQRPGGTPVKKTVSVISADGFTGSIRSQGEYTGLGSVPLNVDASPELLADGKVRVRFSIQYDLPTPPETLAQNTGKVGIATRTGIHQSVVLVLENGKPIVAAQSADPVNDRQVIVEVKATILR